MDPNPKNARVTGPKCGVAEEFRRVRAQVFGGTEYVIQEFHLAVLPITNRCHGSSKTGKHTQSWF